MSWSIGPIRVGAAVRAETIGEHPAIEKCLAGIAPIAGANIKPICRVYNAAIEGPIFYQNGSIRECMGAL